MMQISSFVYDKIEEAFYDYSSTPYSLIERMTGDNTPNNNDIKNKFDDILSNKCKVLGLAETIIVIYLFQTKLHLDHSEYSNHENQDDLLHISKTLDSLFDKKNINTHDLFNPYNISKPLLYALYGKETFKSIISKPVTQINRYLVDLHKCIKTDYAFIKTIDYVRLNDIFVSLHYFESSILEDIINNTLLDIRAVKAFVSPKKSIVKAPGLKQTLQNMCNELLDTTHMDILNMNEFEYISYLEDSLSNFKLIAIPNNIIQDIKECFEFNSSNIQGIANVLYPLFQIVFDKEHFPNHEEWIKEKQKVGQMDTNKDWKKFIKQRVGTKVKLENFFV